MDTNIEGSRKTARRRKERGKEPAKKYPSKRRNPVSQLINQLRQTVFPDSDTRATKPQVLRQTKHYIQQLESTLDTLLKMKEPVFNVSIIDHFHPEEHIPCSLEDVKEEYLQICCSEYSAVPEIEGTSENAAAVWYLTQEYENDPKIVVETKTEQPQSPVSSSPDLMEFERYLHFYQQTVEMLVENGLVSSEQVTHHVVSKAISNLWQELLHEGKADMFQSYIQQFKRSACSLPYPKETVYTEACVRDSGADSQEATSSFLSSTPEEVHE
ncbi:stimulated by retinoic acid gene 8 protein homolog [Bombina bombina]|uniref:stimulated by retinoic acid gene 8 protein homolog n=1 Tax=Bombina bombina TaxID=8345 RepID=UPI00235AF1AE|nr:stimulated by retinoic acid gene 8 protein homolog [Bombina bombina]